LPQSASSPAAPAAQATPGASPATKPQEAAPAGNAKAARAQEVLRQAREALGGEAKLKEVQSFSVSGPFRRDDGGQGQAGELRLDVFTPDKLKVSETLDLIAGIQITLVNGLNGQQAWVDSQTSGGPQVTMMRRPGTGPQGGDGQLKSLQSELTRYLLAFLLMPPPGASVSFSYAGEAEAPEGRAEVLDVEGAAGFKARLFIDKKTHRPLLLSYRDVVRRAKTLKSSTAGGRGDINKVVQDAQSQTAAARQESDVQLHLSDYRAVQGVLLPHHLTKTVDGKPYEEWEVKEFKFNPRDLTPQKFEKPNK
jgi:hypothetical protein